MKLVTFSMPSSPRSRTIGAVTDAGIVDLPLALEAKLSQTTSRARDIAQALTPPDMLRFVENGPIALDHARHAIDFALAQAGSGGGALIHPLGAVRYHAPLPRPASIRDTISFEGHMRFFKERTGRPVPDVWFQRPLYYKGNPATVVGPGDDVHWPAFTETLDYELEVGLIIGRPGVNIAAADAYAHVAGFLVFNDFSARETVTQDTSGNLGPAKGKDFDTGNAMGPWLVTPDEIDPADLAMEARINGEVWSRGRTSDMRWSFADIIAFISRDETLHPGDFIGSGTCEKGCGAEIDRWLKPGDVVELEVEGLGVLRNHVVRETRS